MPVILNVGSNIGDERLASLLSLGVQVPLVRSQLSLLNLLENVIYMLPLNGLVSISVFDNLLVSLKLFPATGSIPTKSY
jgi:hypothetical protein